MEFDLYRIFPLEIWENIIPFCDGKTLKALQRLSKFFTAIIESVDIRRGIWEKNCISEIPADDRFDICQICCPETPHKWTLIYDTWNRWNNILKYDLVKTTIAKNCLSISDVKVSGKMIFIADEIGFTILNSSTLKSKRYKVGSVQKTKLFNRPKVESTRKRRRGEFLHNTLDCTVAANFHLFYDLHKIDRITHLRSDKFEKKVLGYSSADRLVQFRYPIIDADLFEHKSLIVQPTRICEYQIKENFTLSKTNFVWNGARCWFMWHARLLLCAKDETLHLFVNGRMKTILYGQHPRVTAIFYFNGILFLGLVQGSLVLHRINVNDILQLDFENCDKKIDVSQHAIVAINIIETETDSAIIVASESEIYKLRLNILSAQ